MNASLGSPRSFDPDLRHVIVAKVLTTEKYHYSLLVFIAGRWQFLEEKFLENDQKIYVSACEISNIAAFIQKQRIEDVKFSIACFLFNNADGKFVMGFCFDDEAIKAAFCHR